MLELEELFSSVLHFINEENEAQREEISQIQDDRAGPTGTKPETLKPGGRAVADPPHVRQEGKGEAFASPTLCAHRPVALLYGSLHATTEELSAGPGNLPAHEA